MIFYAQETWIGLCIASLPAIVSAYLFFCTDKKNTALGLLLLSAFLLRLLIISLDPFLHEWDERYHALVAKNMVTNPFKPMLVVHPIMAYNMLDWSNSHLWVHKQPLFLWQMAASMKLFGVNEIAMRLPSALMSTALVWVTYDLCKSWIPKHNEVAFIAAFLTTFSAYTLELVSGRLSLEHNDLAFVFYVTCSFWAWSRYVLEGSRIKWAILVGVFVGLAVLNKWLTGYLVFGGWGLYLLLNFGREIRKQHIGHILLAFIISVVIFLPWQLYIFHTFPTESEISYQYNVDHINDDLGHPGNMWTHILFLKEAYQKILLVFGLIGLLALVRYKEVNKKMAISFIAMVVVIFAFFSVIVKTKMPAFVFPVSAILFSFMALGAYAVVDWISERWKIPLRDKNIAFTVLTIGLGIACFKPWDIAAYRSASNDFRNAKINNTSIYENLPEEITKNYVIINCKSFENVELMFYQDANAYHWYPAENVIDSLQQLGYKFAAFQNTPNQGLPAYITDDPEIVILEDAIK
jgi:4-amino-4-deoxy-L-arabinose transferase-like glycosyltransferase